MSQLFIFLNILMVCFFSNAEKNYPFHDTKEQSGEPAQKSFKLAKNRKLVLDLKQNQGDMRFNQLRISLQCPPQRQVIPIEIMPTVCGVLSFSYSAQTEDVILTLVKYNSASPLGDCTGATYTEKVSLAGKCEAPVVEEDASTNQ